VLADDRIELDVLEGELEGLTFSLDGQVPLDSLVPMSINLKVTGNPSSLVDKVRAEFDIPSLAFNGDITLQVLAAGELGSPAVTATLSLPEFEAAGTTVGSAQVAARWRNDTLTLDSAAIDVFGGTVKASGHALTDTTMAAVIDLSLGEIDIARVWSAVYDEKSPYRGKLHGSVAVSGEGEDIDGWDVHADISARQAAYDTLPLPDFRAYVAFSDGTADLRVVQENFDINATGRLIDERLEGNFSVNIIELGPLAGLFNQPEVSGRLQASGSVSGSLQSPEIEADIAAGEILYQNLPLDSLFANLQYEDSVLIISNLEFYGALDSIYPDRPPMHIDSLKGGFKYKGAASGTLDDLRAHLDAEFIAPGYGGFELDSGLIAIQVNGQEADLTVADFFLDSLVVSARGRFRLDSLTADLSMAMHTLSNVEIQSFTDTLGDTLKQYIKHETRTAEKSIGVLSAALDVSDRSKIIASVSGRDFDLGWLGHLFSDTIELAGILHFDAAASGNFANPVAELNATIITAGLGSTTLDSVVVAVAFANDILRVREFKAYGYGQSLTASGAVGLEKDSTGNLALSGESPVEGNLSVTDLDLALLEPFLAEGSEVSGQSSLELQWNGTLVSPNLRGWFEIEDGRILSSPDSDPVEKINLRVLIEDSTLNIEKAGGVILGNGFTLNGFCTLSELKRLEADLALTFEGFGAATGKGYLSRDSISFEAVVGQFDLAVLRPFVPGVYDLSGKLDCRVNVNGTSEAPVLRGSLLIDNLTFRPYVLTSPIEKGVIAATFSKDSLKIDTLSAMLGGGVISVSGEIAHDFGQIVGINLKASVDSVKLSSPKEYSVDIRSVRLKYTRPNEYFLLEGDVELGESRLMTGFRLQSILPWVRAVEQTELELPKMMEQTRMDVRIRESDKLWIDNNLARLRLHTELGVIGSPTRPNFTGRISIEEGYLLYLDRKLQVTEGVIYFFDPNRFNPEIRLRAETRVTAYQATESMPHLIIFSAQGLLDELVVSLYSEPPLEKSDIVALLTLGATRSQLAGKNGDSKGVLLERAQMLSSQRISGYVSRKVGTVFGLDEVSVEGNLFRYGTQAGPQLLASKRISERTTLTYTTTVGHMNEQSFRLDYRLSRRFSLEGQTDQRGKSALSLKYGVLFK
jgi:autotransporter translocation and assembly factor TamB